MSKLYLRPKIHLLPPLFAGSYVKKVQQIDYANLIGYWPMNEASGATAVDRSSQGNDGAYTGVTLANASGPDSKPCPWWDGVNDYNDVYSAGLNGDFDGDEGTIMCWAKVHNVGVWTDAALRYAMRIQVDAANYMHMQKNPANGRFQFIYRAGAVTEQQNSEGHAEVDWFHAAMTWSATADEVIYYFNGVQDGLTDTVLGAWAGVLDECCVGNQAVGSANCWHGWLAHAALWKTPLTAAQIAKLAVV